MKKEELEEETKRLEEENKELKEYNQKLEEISKDFDPRVVENLQNENERLKKTIIDIHERYRVTIQKMKTV